ncbi:MAG: hypothetical protein WCG84_01205 [Candidatus Moraniibacteriota bacterium]
MLPRIIIVREHQLEINRQYSLWIGYKRGKIVCLALSRYATLTTLARLMLCVDVEFTPSTVFVDVYCYPDTENCFVAKFFSTETTYCYDEEYLEPFFRDDTEDEWRAILGIPVSFYPFQGPSHKPEKFPDFNKKLRLASKKPIKR